MRTCFVQGCAAKSLCLGNHTISFSQPNCLGLLPGLGHFCAVGLGCFLLYALSTIGRIGVSWYFSLCPAAAVLVGGAQSSAEPD